MNVNKVMICGRLTRDVELRYTPSGVAVANVNLATNRYYKGSDGEKKEEVTFIRVTIWNKQAEVVNQYCSKGNVLFVEGRLQTRSWEDSSGNKRNTMEVIAEKVQLGGNGKKSENNQETNGEGYPSDMV